MDKRTALNLLRIPLENSNNNIEFSRGHDDIDYRFLGCCTIYVDFVMGLEKENSSLFLVGEILREWVNAEKKCKCGGKIHSRGLCRRCDNKERSKKKMHLNLDSSLWREYYEM